MVVVRSLKEIQFNPNTVATIGTFDGIHLGHRQIFTQVLERARAIGGRSIVITFEPHPREIIGREQVQLLSTLDERLAIIGEFGFDVVLVLGFNYEFSQQTSRQFYEKYIKEVIVGYDHKFGRDRSSSIDELKQMGHEFHFDVRVVEPVAVGNEIISSTKIRRHLLSGDVESVAQYLARPYSVRGTVVMGDRRGNTLGFPTANIEPKTLNKVIPADGVYFVSVKYDECALFGMLNIGVRPTFQSGARRHIEVNIFDVNEELYSKDMTIHFLKRIREEKKFLSKEELIAQLQADRETCLRFVKEIQST
jgi:riboflavin kinase/FMN adenylyltransferase